MFKGTLHLANFIDQLRSGHYWLLLPASCLAILRLLFKGRFVHSLFVAFWEKSGLSHFRVVM